MQTGSIADSASDELHEQCPDTLLQRVISFVIAQLDTALSPPNEIARVAAVALQRK